MTLRELQYLVALHEHEHFGRAAEACFVSQPTLSTQIRKLEDELGVALVERTPRQALLTSIGRDIVGRARNVLDEIDAIHVAARENIDPESGTVHLGIFPTLGPYLLPHVVPRIRQLFPQLELLLVEEKTEVVLEQLHDGKLDAAVLAEPIMDAQLHSHFLFEEPFMLAVPRHHELARQSSVTPAELEGRDLLLLEEGHCLRDQALELCHTAGAGERHGFRATSLETLRQMVAADVGITVLPTLAVQPPIAQAPNVQLIPFRDQAPHRRISMFWRKNSPSHKLLEKLAGVLSQLPPGLLDATTALLPPDTDDGYASSAGTDQAATSS